MKRSLKCRIYPNKEQEDFFIKTFGCRRFVYNFYLSEINNNYNSYVSGENKNKMSVNEMDIIKKLPVLKEKFIFLKDVSSVVLQQTAIDLSKAFIGFFNGKKYPNFKNKFEKQSFRLVGDAFSIRNNKIKISKVPGLLKIKYKINFNVSSLTLTKDVDGKYHINLTYDAESKTTSGKEYLGIDLGLKYFASFSNGDKIENPNFLKKTEKKLKKLHRNLSKKQKGSNNRNKARIRLAKAYSKINNQKNDFLHKLSRKLVNENQVIAIENLNIKGMLKNHNLAKSISSVSWNRFITFLRYKTIESQHCILVEMDRWFPSTQTCSFCDYKNSGKDKLKLKDRLWVCPSCNTTHDRDTNAAQNILNEAMKLVDKNIEYFKGKIVKMEMETF